MEASRRLGAARAPGGSRLRDVKKGVGVREYTTERGVQIQVVPIPLMLDELRRAWEKKAPDAPVIVEHLAGGATEELPITEEMAAAMQEQEPEYWEQHAEAWAQYQKDYTAWASKMNDAIWNAIKMRAIQFEMPADEDWIQEQELLGFEVPEDAVKRRLHYLQTEVLGGVRDTIQITAYANGADLSEEALASAEDSFRSFLEGSLTEGLAGQSREVAA